VALVPRFLVEDELTEGKLVIPWDHPMLSAGAHFLAYAEHAAEVPKIRSFVKWIEGQVRLERGVA
jgi:DNA-binding transcriptional LysR family regulator